MEEMKLINVEFKKVKNKLIAVEIWEKEIEIKIDK